MKRLLTMELTILAYCVILWLTNWRLSTSYERSVGLTSFEIDLRVVGIVAGGIVTFACLRRLWKLSRELFALGVVIPPGERIWGRWYWLWLLTPLVFQSSKHWSSVTHDGAAAESVLKYGGDASFVLILLSASAIMLFQTTVTLESYHRNNAG